MYCNSYIIMLLKIGFKELEVESTAVYCCIPDSPTFIILPVALPPSIKFTCTYSLNPIKYLFFILYLVHYVNVIAYGNIPWLAIWIMNTLKVIKLQAKTNKLNDTCGQVRLQWWLPCKCAMHAHQVGLDLWLNKWLCKPQCLLYGLLKK